MSVLSQERYQTGKHGGYYQHDTPGNPQAVSEPATTNTSGQQAAPNRYHDDETWWHKIDPNWFIAIFTAVLVWVAITQTKIYRRQRELMEGGLQETKRAADAANKSVILAEETAKKQLRAYVSFHFIDAPAWPDSHGVIGFSFVCINHGATPARDVGYRAKAWCLKDPIPDGEKLPVIDGPWNSKRMNIFPCKDSAPPGWTVPCTLGDRFTPEEVKLLNHGYHLVVGLEIEYTNTFNEICVTQEFFVSDGARVELIPGSSYIT